METEESSYPACFSVILESLLRWRKASKCKRLLRRVECRLKLLKSKKCAVMRQARDDVAKLLKTGFDQTIENRVEWLYMDESIITVYELLRHFCKFIVLNLSYILSPRNRDYPNDVSEALSSLVYASARCGEVPELRAFRELLEDHYGHSFVETALYLLPGNHVNIQIIEKLTYISVPEDAKLRLLNEIIRDYSIQDSTMAQEEVPEIENSAPVSRVQSFLSYSDISLPDLHFACLDEMRIFTTPAERSGGQQLELHSRTSSLLFPVADQLHHVHPKLPDYDDFVAGFQDLKQAHQHNQRTSPAFR